MAVLKVLDYRIAQGITGSAQFNIRFEGSANWAGWVKTTPEILAVISAILQTNNAYYNNNPGVNMFVAGPPGSHPLENGHQFDTMGVHQ